jgi:archaellum component FlaC
MTDYNFDYTPLSSEIDKISSQIDQLEIEFERFRDEMIETDNTLYEILNRLDMLEQKSYDVPNY